MKQKQSEHICGECCWFYGEDTYGCGVCPFQFAELRTCDEPCNINKFISKQQMRRYLAVLTQANRYRRDRHVPAIYKMPNLKDLGEAIDFAIKYVKTFNEL